MKRIFDLSIIFLTLIIWLPLIIIVSIFVFIFMGRPIFYIQKRVGKKNEIFNLIKFRSMKNSLIKNESDKFRLNFFGRFLRSTSFDELPEIWNVIVGDMSLVGPRPLLEEYLPLYDLDQARRHEILPGITGWAQINGRNNITWQEKFLYDIWYVENHSTWIDIKIIFLTIIKVLKGEGISAEGEATMSKFTGNK